jgi:hypothetical protein
VEENKWQMMESLTGGSDVVDGVLLPDLHKHSAAFLRKEQHIQYLSAAAIIGKVPVGMISGAVPSRLFAIRQGTYY